MRLEAILETIDRLRTAAPDRVALSQDGGRELTYAELGRKVDSLCAGLNQAGLRQGDAVVFSVRPTIEAVLLIMAAVRCGGVIVASDPGMSPTLFASRIALLKPKWVMTESFLYTLGRLRVVRSWLERRGVMLPNVEVPGARLVLTGRWPAGSGTLNYRDLAATPGVGSRVELDPGAAAFVAFTSGTTSAPKGVIHTRRSIASSLEMIGSLLGLQASDRVYSNQLHMIIPGLLAGATVHIAPHRFSTERSIRDLERFQPSHVCWVPAQLQQLIDHASNGHPLPESLRVILLASAPVPAGLLRRWAGAFPKAARVFAAYGMTEILPVCWIEMTEKLHYEGRGDLVGAPCPGVELRIGLDGEVFIKGPNLCAGYVGGSPIDEVASGDMGLLDEGRLVLLGRKKDMIIRGSYNIYPDLIEGVVASVPGVRRCAMVGLYNEERADEMVVLAVEPDPAVDSADLEARVRRSLDEGPNRIDVYARPDHVLITQIPTSGRSNKVDKQAVRDIAVRCLAC